MGKQTVTISVLADTKQFSSAFKKVAHDSGLTSLGNSVKKFGKVVAASMIVATTAVAAFGASTVGVASELQQSIGAIETVAGKYADTIIKASKSAATEYGVSAQEYLQSSTLLITQLSNQGIAMKDAIGLTETLYGRASDMAATFGTTTTQATDAISAGLRGEYDSLEQFGITIKASMVQARAALDGTSEAQAYYNIVMEQTGGYAGQFASESNTWAHQVQVLQAKWTDFRAELGNYLLPALTAVATYVNDNLDPAFNAITTWIDNEAIPAFQTMYDAITTVIIPAIQEWVDQIKGPLMAALEELKNGGLEKLQSFGQWFLDNKDPILAITSAVAGFVAGVKAVEGVSAAINTVKTIGSSLSALWGVLAANPIIIVVGLIAALVGGLVYFFTQTETGKETWDTIWGGIQSVVQGVADWFQNTFLPIWDEVWGTVTEIMGEVGGWMDEHLFPVFEAGGELISAIVNTIGTLFSILWNNILQPIFGFISSAWNILWTGVQAVWNVIGPPIIALVTGAFTGMKIALSVIWNIIKTVIETVLGVIKGIIQVVTGIISGDWRKVWEGIKTVASSIWNGIKSVISTVINGIKDTISNVLSTIKNVWSTAWNKISEIATNAWNGIKNFFVNSKSAITGVFDDIGSAIKNAFRTAFNAVAGFWNNSVGSLSWTAPSWVPLIGGKTISVPKIPKLATGGIVTSATYAMIGEGAEPEAILPLSKLKDLLGGRMVEQKPTEVNQTITYNYTATVEVSKLTEVEEIKNLFANTSWQLQAV